MTPTRRARERAVVRAKYRFQLFGFLRDGHDFDKLTPFDLGIIVDLHPARLAAGRRRKK